MADHYVYSTLSAPMDYTTWKQGGADLPSVESVVHIAGGANVVDRKHLITPRGVVTPITGEQLAQLENNEVFKLHRENGYITVENKLDDADKVAGSGMTGREPSAPLVEQDFEEGKAPKLSAEEVTEPKANPRKA